MEYGDRFFSILGAEDRLSRNRLASVLGIPIARLRYYNERNVVPTGNDLRVIEEQVGVSERQLKLKMGRIDREILEAISDKYESIDELLETPSSQKKKRILKPALKTKLGKLYQSDCLEFLSSVKSESVDMVFADPPFNLRKLYPSKINDDLKEQSYLDWCDQWIRECARVLNHGGSFLLWNIPKWNVQLASLTQNYLSFRNWIAVDIKFSLPIKGRLYPSHYSLLYFVKGVQPSEFSPDRLPMPVCPKCYSDLRDYGGYKSKMNPKGVSLTDVWLDIDPVRHSRYKKRVGSNELSLKLMDRVIEMTTKEGDLILDPFGGSGTTYVAAELKKRKWVGCEIGPIDQISDRLMEARFTEKEHLSSLRSKVNALFLPSVKAKRLDLGKWTDDTIR